MLPASARVTELRTLIASKYHLTEDTALESALFIWNGKVLAEDSLLPHNGVLYLLCPAGGG
jgi:hypothetical protein